MTLKQAHKDFIQNLKEKNRAEATVTAYSKDLEQLVEYIEKKGVSEAKDVESQHLNDFMQKLATEGYTPKSISRKTNSTKTFFKYLYEDLKALGTNPADLVSHPKLEHKAPRILSKIEYKALRDAVKDDVRTLAIVEILLQTGLRISELSDIKLENINLSEEIDKKDGNLFVPGKGNTPDREIPLNPAVQKSIKNYIALRPFSKKDFLFVTKTGNQLLVRNIRATLDKYFKDIGLDNVKVNDLRHTFIAHHLQNGAPLYMVSKIAGHKRISTTEKYLEYVTVKRKEGNFELQEL